ncbi:uncharacterized protein EV422DRAFT_568325 [Fimicolochytrium jonesii]|uniref:uncharacterized protein n=1 Tax=Fimicolochytrium jonesii TaxID=1396493 RepID=UPI0022FE0375|nr:uncharacterized protein EV422DRAFT_568325 [Fimicolochytrium jonesii]KAI8819867.1 hypothetical protein EV422DRAFT_568325 [Fimicolochytrium jonesii]
MAFAASSLAPITGRFKKRVVRDLVGSITFGTAAAYYWWNNSHLPKMAEYKAYDSKVRAELIAEHGEWAIGSGQQQRLDEKRGVKSPGQSVE